MLEWESYPVVEPAAGGGTVKSGGGGEGVHK